jgi:hypothetical protein
MIEPLHDAHTFLAAGNLRQTYNGYRPDPNKLNENDLKRVAEIIQSKYIRGGLRCFCRDKVKF